MLGSDGGGKLALTLLTFGFKNGPPRDADLTLDVRFLPNPHYVDELRPLTGLDEQVRDYVESGTQAGRVLRPPAAAARVPRPGLRRRGQEPPDDRDRLHRRSPPLGHRRRPDPPRPRGPRRRDRAGQAPRRRARLVRIDFVGEPVIRAQRPAQELRRRRGGPRHRPRGERRRGLRLPRPQRRRQDDDRRDPRGLSRPRTPARSRSSARIPAHGDRAWRERIGDRPAELPARSLPDRARVARALRRLLPRRRARSRRRSTWSGWPSKADARAGSLSGGQQRRLDVGMALIGDPELLFLDEPTTGFDPSARRQAWELIAGLRDLGKTVFLTTHYMDEAQRLADRVAIIADGEIVARGTPQDLGDRDAQATTITYQPQRRGLLDRDRRPGRGPPRADRPRPRRGFRPRGARGLAPQPRGHLPGADPAEEP